MAAMGTATRIGATLVIEDDHKLRNNIRQALQRSREGNVVACATLREADVAWQNSEGVFDEVIADYRMVDGDGLSFLLKIKEHRPNVACTLVTGNVRHLKKRQHDQLKSAGIGLLDKKDMTAIKVFLGSPSTAKELDVDDPAESARPDYDVQLQRELELKMAKEDLAKSQETCMQLVDDFLRRLDAVKGPEKFTFLGPEGEVTIDRVRDDVVNLTPQGVRWIKMYSRAIEAFASRYFRSKK